MKKPFLKINKFVRLIYNFIFIHRFPKFMRLSSYPYLTGDTLRKLSDHIYDETKAFNPDNVAANELVFVKSDMLNEYFNSLHKKINSRYRLLTHNSDENIDGKHISFKDNKILVWYAQNLLISESEFIKPIPIGLENRRYLNNGLLNHFKFKKNIIKNNYILCSFDDKNIDRTKVKEIAKNKNLIEIRAFSNHRKYVKELSSYRFNICPPGNGIDTHRIWESLMVKTIPIVKKNEFATNLVNNGVPLLQLESWNNLLSYDIEHLEKIYLKLSSKFDMQKITKVSYWLN